MKSENMEYLLQGFMLFIIILLAAYFASRFLVIPMIRYNRVKKNIVSEMIIFLESLYPDPDNVEIENKEITENHTLKSHGCKNLSAELEKCYKLELPLWYKNLLHAKGEFPHDAALHLMGLAISNDYEHAWNRIKRIAKALRIN